MRVHGRTAIVPGGASGLGNASARVLAAAGANVILLDLPQSEGEGAARLIGGGAVFVGADVTDESAVQAAVDGAVERFGGLHIVVNCAGIGSLGARVLDEHGEPLDLARFRKIVDVNLVGTFNVVRLAAAAMSRGNQPKDGERGVIVNTASIAAFEGMVGQVAYAASKGGVVSMTLPLARDLARSGIRVVTLAPGTFETPMLGERFRKALAADIPHPPRLGRPDEFGLMVRQLIEQPYINGEVIRLDGALRLKAD